MKKKNLKKLTLNKKAVSNLDKATGGQAGAPTAVPVGTRVASGCPICATIRPTNCATQNNQCASAGWLNISCWIC